MALLPPIIIDDVRPSTPAGFPAKAVAGQPVPVSAVLVAIPRTIRNAPRNIALCGTVDLVD